VRKTCLIFNARAGAAAEATEWLQTEAAHRKIRLFPASQPDQTRNLAAEARQEGYDRLIVAGGDGSVSQVVNGLAPHFSDVELAIIPLGTGNDLARALDLPLDSLADAMEIAADGGASAIDVVQVSGPAPSYFINAATGGVGAKVAADVAGADKARWGAFAYWMTAVTKLMELQEYRVRLELDQQMRELALYGLIVANGLYIGGGFPIAPGAALNDGWMNITAVPVLPTLELLAAGLQFTFAQSYPENVLGLRARHVRIISDPEMLFSVDGEASQAIDTTLQILPSVLPVVAGAEPPGLRREPADEEASTEISGAE
jgi:diacylglycerol kinase (ATP)